MNNKKENKITIGIDLGTTNTVVYSMDENKHMSQVTFGGSQCLPSVVCYDVKNGKPVVTAVGEEAINNAALNPGRVIFESKRFIGVNAADIKPSQSGHSDDIRVITQDMLSPDKNYGVNVVVKNNKIQFALTGEDGSQAYVTPTDVAVAILQHVFKTICTQQGWEISDSSIKIHAVITVPAYFNNTQREETSTAGSIAGFTVERIINEPVSAIIAYAQENPNIVSSSKETPIICIDIGGGTTDLSYCTLAMVDKTPIIEVKATTGDLALGGKDVDSGLAKLIIKKISEKNSNFASEVAADKMKSAKLRSISESAKKKMSPQATQSTDIHLSSIDNTYTGKITLHRAEVDDIMESTLSKPVCRLVSKLIKQNQSDWNETNQCLILVTGGGSYNEGLLTSIRNLVDKEAKNQLKILSDRSLLRVAEGATISAGSICNPSSDSSDILLLDVTPLGLGIETVGGINTIVVPAHSTIPLEKKQVFSTASDNQPSVQIHILQGDRPSAKDCLSMGTVNLEIAPAPRGVPQIEVIFSIDVNGLISVRARDAKSNKEVKTTINGKTTSKEDIERMRKQAEDNLEYDRKLSENATIRNEAENNLYQSRKAISEAGDKLNADIKASVESKITVLDEELKKESDLMKMDTQTIQRMTSELNAEMMKIYENTANPNTNDSTTNNDTNSNES